MADEKVTWVEDEDGNVIRRDATVYHEDGSSTTSHYENVDNCDRLIGWRGAMGADSVTENDPDGNSTSSSRVICTHFYQKGLLPREVWRADMAFTQTHISGVTIRGYHYWGIPYVKLMRRSPFAERIMFPIVKWRAEELAYQMGVLPRANFKGKLVRIFGESFCGLLGSLVSQKDWRVLTVAQNRVA